jgi:23S rRNA (cytosine1962-C5)-methyltransferase
MNAIHYRRIVVKKGREVPLLHGHPWLFSGAVASADKGIEPGEVVLAASSADRPLALGFFNHGDIAFRLLTDDVNAVIDRDFWRRRVAEALALRMKIIPPDTDSYRLVNAEGDGMPGLVIDRYRDCLVVGIGTAGIERWREVLMELLVEATGVRAVYERSEGRSRKIEGLDDRIGPVFGPAPEPMEITENGLRFQVDVQTGQKTGFFLDQRVSRELVGGLSKGCDVLNCFSYTGGFSLYAMRGGARRVVSVEASAAANESAAANFRRNGFDAETNPILKADCFDYLRRTTDRYDLIILDPPALAKSRKDQDRAAHGYKEINLQAARRIAPGGLLATFSCSNPIDEELFGKIVLGAVRDAGKTAQLLWRTGAGPDHPINLAHPEGRYLKGLFLCLTDR